MSLAVGVYSINSNYGNSPNFEKKTPIFTDIRKDKLRCRQKPTSILKHTHTKKSLILEKKTKIASVRSLIFFLFFSTINEGQVAFRVNIALEITVTFNIPTLFIQFSERERYQRFSLYDGIRPDVIDLESILMREENRSTRRKTLEVRLRSTETQPPYDLEARDEPGSQRWEARFETTKPSCLPFWRLS